jgi:hypothetical protein
MKCPACWSEDTATCCQPRLLDRCVRVLLLSTCTCRHCFHRFYVPFWMVSPSAPRSYTVPTWGAAAGGQAQRKRKAA